MKKLYTTFRIWIWSILIDHLPDKQLEKLMDYNRDKRGYWLARLPWYAYWAYRIEIINKEIEALELYDDPMNGCPGDFMASDIRQLDGLRARANIFEYKTPYIVRMVLDYFIEAYQETAWAEHHENCPWA